MIEYRSFVPMNPDREEINELEHSPFNLHANEGNIHRYAAGLIPSHWHRELEIFLLLLVILQFLLLYHLYLI